MNKLNHDNFENKSEIAWNLLKENKFTESAETFVQLLKLK